MLNLENFRAQSANMDFQRTNMFSVSFATKPGNKASSVFDSIGTQAFEYLGINGNQDGLGLLDNILGNITKNALGKVKVNSKLIGAMSTRTVQTLLGKIDTGSHLLAFFDEYFKESGLMIYSVKMPENRLGYEMDKNYAAPNIKITNREYEPLIISFRMDASGSNYRAMNDWVNSVENPITGLRAFPDQVESSIQVTLYDRVGMPHTVALFDGCIPVGISSPELSWESNNTVSTFDVTFAYRNYDIGGLSVESAADYIDDFFAGIIDGDRQTRTANDVRSMVNTSINRLNSSGRGMSGTVMAGAIFNTGLS